jgi:hypothetical protein
MDYSWPRALFQLSKTGYESVVQAVSNPSGLLAIVLQPFCGWQGVKPKAVAVPILVYSWYE